MKDFSAFEAAFDGAVNGVIAETIKDFMPGPSPRTLRNEAYYEGVRDAVLFITEYNDWLES